MADGIQIPFKVGPTGPDGLSLPGDTGPTGAPGSDGLSGPTGADGVPGTVRGLQGPPGGVQNNPPVGFRYMLFNPEIELKRNVARRIYEPLIPGFSNNLLVRDLGSLNIYSHPYGASDLGGFPAPPLVADLKTPSNFGTLGSAFGVTNLGYELRAGRAPGDIGNNLISKEKPDTNFEYLNSVAPVYKLHTAFKLPWDLEFPVLQFTPFLLVSFEGDWTDPNSAVPFPISIWQSVDISRNIGGIDLDFNTQDCQVGGFINNIMMNKGDLFQNNTNPFTNQDHTKYIMLPHYNLSGITIERGDDINLTIEITVWRPSISGNRSLFVHNLGIRSGPPY